MSTLKAKSRDWPLDYWLIGLVAILMVLGLSMVASSSVAISEKRFADPFHYLTHQALAMGLGLIAGGLVLQIPLKFWESHRLKIFMLGIALLIAVLIVGKEINGSKRWIPLLVMNFQVSEFMKIAVVVFMAGYLERHATAVQENLSAMLRLALPFGLMAVLLLIEPDFGSTFVIAVIITGLLLIAGAPWLYFAITVLPIIALLAVMVLASGYRRERVINFLDPWADPFGDGYQMTQALIASGQGEWFGVGIGQSIQKLLYLPEAHTDFLLSIFAEEYGFIGVVLLALLYLAICYRLFRIGRKAIEQNAVFGGLIAYGVAVWIAVQAVINMGVNFGLFPTKGLTLPLMSYGGSSVLLILIALALALRVDFETRQGRFLTTKTQADEDDH